jgi:hypothetical protein
MSHVESIKTKITNLEALKDAVKDMGAIWREGKTTYQWYGRHVGDYPLPEGMTAEDLGKCTHAITLPGTKYEIGVVQTGPTEFRLLYDFYGNGHKGHDGQNLKRHFGDGCSKLVDYYQHHVARRTIQPGQTCIKIDSLEAARKASALVGQRIEYQNKLRTLIVQQ